MRRSALPLAPGGSWAQQTLHALGCDTLLQTNAAGSLDAATGLIVAAEQTMAESGRDSQARDIATARVDTYREREVLYKRLQAEIKTLEMLLLSWEHEVLAQDQTVSLIERFKDLLDRMKSWFKGNF